MATERLEPIESCFDESLNEFGALQGLRFLKDLIEINQANENSAPPLHPDQELQTSTPGLNPNNTSNISVWLEDARAQESLWESYEPPEELSHFHPTTDDKIQSIIKRTLLRKKEIAAFQWPHNIETSVPNHVRTDWAIAAHGGGETKVAASVDGKRGPGRSVGSTSASISTNYAEKSFQSLITKHSHSSRSSVSSSGAALTEQLSASRNSDSGLAVGSHDLASLDSREPSESSYSRKVKRFWRDRRGEAAVFKISLEGLSLSIRLRNNGYASGLSLENLRFPRLIGGIAHTVAAQNGLHFTANLRKTGRSDVLTVEITFAPHAEDTIIKMDFALEAVLQESERNGWRRCYNCRTMVELSVGCRHITCKCGAEFCYVCGARWKTCPCTESDQARRQEQIVRQRNQFDEEARAVADAIRQVEELERREAEEEERMVLEQERRDEQRRQEEAERMQREEEERQIAIQAEYMTLKAELRSVQNEQRVLLNKRHHEDMKRLHEQMVRSEAQSIVDRQQRQLRIEAEKEGAIHQLEMVHAEALRQMEHRHEEEEDDYFIGIRAHLRGKPNREAREKTAVEKIKKTQSEEKQSLASEHDTARSHLLHDGANMQRAMDQLQEARQAALEREEEFLHQVQDQVAADLKWFEIITFDRDILLLEEEHHHLRPTEPFVVPTRPTPEPKRPRPLNPRPTIPRRSSARPPPQGTQPTRAPPPPPLPSPQPPGSPLAELLPEPSSRAPSTTSTTRSPPQRPSPPSTDHIVRKDVPTADRPLASLAELKLEARRISSAKTGCEHPHVRGVRRGVVAPPYWQVPRWGEGTRV
ncbi:MAG: hypothetical protein M1833_001230 [Piccolia ochrophora]|nr:MAG: hypothetical protein M1833_001230 [Piccolia ochrophora]